MGDIQLLGGYNSSGGISVLTVSGGTFVATLTTLSSTVVTANQGGAWTVTSSTGTANVNVISSTAAQDVNAYQKGPWNVGLNSGTNTIGTITAQQGGAWTVTSSTGTANVNVISSTTTNFTPSSTDVSSIAGIVIPQNLSRQSWMITNNSSGQIVYIGNNTVSSSNGQPLTFGQTIIDSMPGVYIGNVYGVVSSGTANVRYLEES